MEIRFYWFELVYLSNDISNHIVLLSAKIVINL